MKKLLFLILLAMSVSIATHAQETKDKVKKTSTMGQKVHNTFSKHKHYKGYKTKHKHGGKKHKHKVDNKDHEVKDKNK
jgi:Ni/Co efflux regulator RcnB